uniref:Aryl hydrocarbon receptor interacting protein like 2 n=1 Tax=Cyclopterus lumpus TaxID=8103 RepID=A0A8C2WRH8_CYCLU
MEETYLLNLPGVRKKILAGGTAALPHFAPGTKVLVFHFQTLLDNFERTIIDDSRLAGRPAEIFFGKMFKMEVWETLLGSMRVGEVAEFWCDAIVGDPMSYQRESWMMEKDEKLQTVPIFHMQGNLLVKQRQYREAASKYKEAVLLLKTVQSREMPGDIDYNNLGRMIIPLELNYCQCMLELEEYYEAIEHTTELLEKHKGNNCVKGYYKRAKAHAAVWNEKEARRDFNMVAHLDITLASLIGRELKALSESMKEKYWEEKEKYWNKLEKKKNNNTEEEIHDKDEEEEEEGDNGKQEDSESVTTESEDEVGEEKDKAASPPILCAEVCLPLTLNLSQCMLELKQHQQVVELNNKLLKKHKGIIC